MDKQNTFMKYRQIEFPSRNRIHRMSRGFTLLEILLVVAAIAILAGIVIVAINPGQQLAETRDVQRRSDVNAIANALVQYYIKNGDYPDNLESSDSEGCKPYDESYGICAEDESCSDGSDLSALSSDDYITAIPSDPSVEDVSYSGYSAFEIESSSRVKVCAPLAEEDEIFVTR
jgi:prepilin-type N-terminal cleavage/methylation domain-containing protein